MSSFAVDFYEWLSSKVDTKQVASSALVLLLLGYGWKLWKRSADCTKVLTSRRKANPEERNQLSTNSELLEYLSSSMPMEFTPCIKFLFELVDRKKYATDSKLSTQDFQLLKPYADSAMPLRCNATISAPHMHVTCLNALNGSICLENSNVDEITCLDIGSGSGFISAALCHLMEYHGKKGKVLAIDHISDLVELGKENVERDESSKQFLEESDSIRLVFKVGNGYDPESIRNLFKESFLVDSNLSNNENIPLFDLIHMGAASPNLPQHLYKLLKPNGRLVCPVGPSVGVQELLCIEKQIKLTSPTKVLSETATSPISESGQQFREIQLVQSIAKVHFVPLFSSTEEQERHFNRSNPRVIRLDSNENVVVLPYLHLIDNSITNFEDIKWEGED